MATDNTGSKGEGNSNGLPGDVKLWKTGKSKPRRRPLQSARQPVTQWSKKMERVDRNEGKLKPNYKKGDSSDGLEPQLGKFPILIGSDQAAEISTAEFAINWQNLTYQVLETQEVYADSVS